MRTDWSATLAIALMLAAAPALAQNPDPTPARTAVSASARSATASTPVTLDYVVQRGDTLIDLAIAYMNQPLDYRRVQRENNVRDPRRLAIGRTLVFPVEMLRADPDEARIAGYRGLSTLSQNSRSAAPVTGQAVHEGAVLSTGANAFVRLALSDGSHVVVPSNSRVRVSRLRRYAINGAVDHALTVETGRAESRVTPRSNPGGFAIRTPVSVSAVRGTDFRVSFDENAERSTTEVLDGAVVITSGKAEAVAVAVADQGVSAASGALRLVTLLPVPALVRPDAPQTQSQVAFDIHPLPGAARYRGRVATDAGMIDAFAEADSEPGGGLVFENMQEGAYFLRLSALSPEGLEGKATTYSFIHARNGVGGLATAMDQRERRRFYRFRWEADGVGEAAFRFQLWRETPDGAVDGPALVDQPGLTEETFTLSDLPPGVYSWRVQSARHRFGRLLEAWSEPQQLRIGQ